MWPDIVIFMMKKGKLHNGTTDKTISQSFAEALHYAQALQCGEHIPATITFTMLKNIPLLRRALRGIEVELTSSAMQGYTWEEIATATGRSSKHAARQWYRRIGGTKTSPAGRPPNPVDITPPELTPKSLERNEAPGWAESAATLDEVTNWEDRTATAWVRYEVLHGVPLNPYGPTGRIGRALPRWGENRSVSSAVTADHGVDRHLLLIQHGDTGKWLLPSSALGMQESPIEVMNGCLRDSVSINLDRIRPQILPATYVDDDWSSDHS